jgi:hypothetical protein
MANEDIDLSETTFRMSNLTLELKGILLTMKECENQPLVSLEKAIEPLICFIPDLEKMVLTVKQNCQKPKDNLTSDESASIMLYTLEWESQESSFYFILNETLREESREKLKAWVLYFRLFIFALSKLPLIKHKIIYRTIKTSLNETFPNGKTFIWWSFTSCTSSIEVLKNSLDENSPRILFNIECNSAKDISQHSFYPIRKQILIYPARKFQIFSSLDVGHHLNIIHLKEIQSPFPLIQISHSTTSFHKHQDENVHHLIQQSQLYSKIFLREKNLNDDDIIDVIDQTIINKKCKELFLGINKITSISIPIIAKALNNNTTLKLLDLSENPITDIGIQSLTKTLAINNCHLQYLYLYSTGITDQGATDLAQMLKTNTILIDLDLGENQITDYGIKFLSNILTNHNHTLTALSLKKNKLINDTAVDSLIQMLEHNQSLKFLNIAHCNLSSTEKERLRENTQSKSRFRLEI